MKPGARSSYSGFPVVEAPLACNPSEWCCTPEALTRSNPRAPHGTGLESGVRIESFHHHTDASPHRPQADAQPSRARFVLDLGDRHRVKDQAGHSRCSWNLCLAFRFAATIGRGKGDEEIPRSSRCRSDDLSLSRECGGVGLQGASGVPLLSHLRGARADRLSLEC